MKGLEGAQASEPARDTRYDPLPKQLTFMQKKLLLLQQQNLASFGNTRLGEGPKRLSKLEQERTALREVTVQPKADPQVSSADFWSSTVKKRSRLEIEKAESLPEPAPTKRKKVDDTTDYWSKFGSEDFFAGLLKKKSRLELEKENAVKARIKEQEEQAKDRDSIQARKSVVLAFDTQL